MCTYSISISLFLRFLLFFPATHELNTRWRATKNGPTQSEQSKIHAWTDNRWEVLRKKNTLFTPLNFFVEITVC